MNNHNDELKDNHYHTRS